MGIFLPALVAFLLATAIMPFGRLLALRIGLVDAPDGHRKLHQHPIPLGGGVVVFVATTLALLLSIAVELPGTSEILRQPRFSLGFLGACALICFIGLLDDYFEIRGRQKLAAQFVAVCLVVQGGLVIKTVSLFGWNLDLGLLAGPFTMFWLLGAINALNLIDGIDGLAGTVGVILSGTFAGLALMTGHPADAMCAAALAGGILGFLIYNLPPAKVYLGDAGSMLIGLALGVMAIRSALKGPTTVALVAPTAIWAILVFDVLMAILRRTLTGQSVYMADRSHLHHVLQKRGLSIPVVLAVVGLLCLICAAGALLSVALKNEMVAVGTAAAVLAMLVVTGFFGRSECKLFARRLGHVGISLVRFPRRDPPLTRNYICSRFHGNRQWELLWESLVEYADRFDLSVVQLNVNSPSIGEEYHAAWTRKAQPPQSRTWRTEIPLFQRSLGVGRLTVVGDVGEGAVVTWMAELIEGLRPFEMQLTELLREQESDDSSSSLAPVPVRVR